MPLHRFVLLLLLAASVAAPFDLSAASPTPTALAPANYESRLADARRFGAEGSWALARDAYAEALKLAPDADAHRWCELWLEDATWRAENEPDDWQTYQVWQARHIAEYDRLLAPYAKGLPRDDFWAAAAEAKGFVLGRKPWQAAAAIGLWREVGAFLGQQPCTDIATDRLIGFLQRVFSERDLPEWHRGDVEEFFSLLERGSDIGRTLDQRAWCALTLARLETGVSKERAVSWQRALKLSEGTRLAALARAEESLWRAEAGWHPDQMAGSAVDVPALVREAAGDREALERTPVDATSQRVISRLKEFEQRLTDPILSVNIAATFTPGDSMSFAYGATGFDRLDVEIYEHTAASWGQWELAPKEVRLELVARKVRAWTIAQTPKAERRWQSEVVPVVPALPPGLYTLVVQGVGGPKGTADRSNFVVSSAAGVAVADGAGARSMFLFDAATGKPLAERKVTGVVVYKRDVEPWAHTTDGTGRLTLPVVKIPEFEGEMQIVAVVDGQPVPIALSAWNLRQERPLVADFFVDRPLYRPGEKAYWKAIVRERRDGRWRIPSVKLTMKVALRNEPLAAPIELALDRFGSAHGEIEIPIAARPGPAEVELTTGRKDDEVACQSELFVVDEYVPPAVSATLELASGPDSLRPGREVAARVKVTYLSGGPAAGARVQLETKAETVPGLEFTAPEGSLLDDWMTKMRAEQREGVTDARGAAEFRFRLPARMSGQMMLQLTATALPEGGQAVHAGAAWRVTPAGRVLDTEGWTTPQLVSLPNPVTFTCRVRDGAGQPAAINGVAQLVERRWVEAYLDPQGRIVDRPPEGLLAPDEPWMPNPSLPDGWAKLHTGYVETVVASKLAEVGPDGELKASFAPSRAGMYRLQVIDADSGTSVSPAAPRFSRDEPFVIVAADSETHSLPVPPGATNVFAASRVRFGDPVSAFVVLPEGQSSAVVTFAGEDQTVNQRFDFQGRAGMVTFREWPRCAGHGTIAVFPLGAEERRAGAEFAVDQAAGQLHIDTKADVTTPRPGTISRIGLGVHSATGAPRRSEIALAVSDEAVNGLIGLPEQVGIIFVHPGAFSQPSIARSPGPSSRKPSMLRDPRVGAVVVFGRAGKNRGDDEELVTLSPFEVMSSSDEGYRASTTLAGTRLQAPALEDIPAAISVVTGQFAQDARAENSRDLLAYTTSAEVGGAKGNFAGREPPIRVRTHFASTAFWSPDILTDEKGEATVEFKYPDNLTTWRVAAYAIGEDGDSFGRAAVFTRTSLPFQARLQTPRFLVAGDTAEPSALLVNRTDADLIANAELKVAGAVQFLPVGAHLGAPAPRTDERAQQAAPLQHESILVTKQGEARIAWQVRAAQRGEGTLTLTARAGTEGDAMITTLPVFEDGMQQETAVSGRLAAGAAQQTMNLVLPDPLDRARTAVTAQVSPGHAEAILDALPYLVDYPYGCVEQTMSRFFPAIIVKKTLGDLGFDAAAVGEHILARESKADSARRAETAGLGKLDDVVERSLARLVEAQREDGSFGWWPGASFADKWMSAYVVWGLGAAESADVDVPTDLAEKANAALVRMLAEGPASSDVDAWALAALHRAQLDERETISAKATFQRAYVARDGFSSNGRACLTLAAAEFGDESQRALLLRNLENGAQRVRSDDSGDTVHWGASSGYWRAMDGAVESTALTLLALLEVDPKHPLIEPAANWLVLNRRSSHWASTRDTAFAVLALARYVTLRGEAKPDAEVELLVNGKPVRRLKLTRESLLEGPLTLPIELAALRPGDNRIELRRVAGKTPVYSVAVAFLWAQSDAVKPAGHLADVARGFVRQKAQPTLIGTLRITPEPLPSGGSAIAGEQVTARVTITVPNELEYVMVEVPKPAGCEPLNPLSGWDARLIRVATGDGAASVSPSTEKPNAEPANDSAGESIYREEHDDKSVFFLDHVEAGTWEIRFGMRATTPGDYRALPVTAQAMYVPEIRANSDARRVRIVVPEADRSQPVP